MPSIPGDKPILLGYWLPLLAILPSGYSAVSAMAADKYDQGCILSRTHAPLRTLIFFSRLFWSNLAPSCGPRQRWWLALRAHVSGERIAAGTQISAAVSENPSWITFSRASRPCTTRRVAIALPSPPSPPTHSGFTPAPWPPNAIVLQRETTSLPARESNSCRSPIRARLPSSRLRRLPCAGHSRRIDHRHSFES